MVKQSLSAKVLTALAGKRLATAESLTGGGIGQALTSVNGASAVFTGGVICYTNQVKHKVLGVSRELLEQKGPDCKQVAIAMAEGVKKILDADVAVSVTGLAGPEGDKFGIPIGTVFIGYTDDMFTLVQEYHFEGSRSDIREATIIAALQLILAMNCQKG